MTNVRVIRAGRLGSVVLSSRIGASTVAQNNYQLARAVHPVGQGLLDVVAGLVGQGYSCWDAAVLGTHLHGLAGDLAAEKYGTASLIASDLLDYLPAAFLSHMGESN